MNNFNYIFDILSFVYKKPQKKNSSDFDEKNLKDILIRNNLLTEYYFKNKDCKLELDQNYNKKLKSKIISLKNSIDICEQHIDNFLIFKTYRGNNFLRVPNDLDIIINKNDYEICKNKFLKKGFEIKDEIIEEGSYGLHKENFLKIHVHTEISWCEKKFVSNDFLFENPQKVKFHDKSIKIPNMEAEFLITIAHGNFEPLHLMISEIVYLYSMIKYVDINKIYHHAKENNWDKTLKRNLGALNDLHNKIYGDKIDKLNKFDSNFKDVFLNYHPPYTYKRFHLIKSVIETRIFKYVIGKVPKVLEHIFKMNTFNYLKPPEK